MNRPRPNSRFVGLLVVAMLGVVLAATLSAQIPLRPLPEALAAAPAELVGRLRADPFTYFRFINRAWTARVCEAFADVTGPVIVRLHGDAHVEQFAFTSDAWGLTDFDDSTRGPAYIDIVRFLGSIDLATRERGWTQRRDALWDRFFEGYRRGLTDADFRPLEPAIVRRLRRSRPGGRAVFLAWGETQMQPLDEARLQAVATGMAELDRIVRAERTGFAPGYFTVVRAGALRLGVGSAAARKVLVRVQGPTTDPDDDVLLEAKQIVNLEGLSCLEQSTSDQAVRVIDGTRQLSRFKHDILAVERAPLTAAVDGAVERWLDWAGVSWEPSYQEVQLRDLRSVDDLAEIVYDSAVQLGANKLVAVRPQALSAAVRLEARLRQETRRIVEELLAGWRELAAQ